MVVLKATKTTLESKLWLEVDVPDKLGIAKDKLKWRQDQTFVEIFMLLPDNCPPKSVSVTLTKDSIHVLLGQRTVLAGDLYTAIKVDSSHWYMGRQPA